MVKNNYFVGVRFNKDKQLFNKIKQHDLSNSEILRKSAYYYFRSKEENHKIDSGSYDQDLVKSFTDQISFLQDQISFLQKQNAFLSLPWYKKAIYQLESKPK